MFLITKNTVETYARKNAGGKGLNLYYLAKHDFKVPKFCVIPPHAFSLFKKTYQLDNILENLLSSKAGPKEIESDLEKLFIEKAKDGLKENQELYSFLKNAYQYLNTNCLSVRSSALGEDSGSHSFAGQLSSYLYITTLEDTLASIVKCWASAYSERSIVYRQQNGITLENIQVAVVLQEMVFSEKSGVVFTGNPINKNPHELIINAVHGVGEGLVGGHLPGDNFVIDKLTNELVSKEINEQTSIFTGLPDGKGLQKQSYKKNEGPVLSDNELEDLCLLGKKVEKFYQFPQDIEFAFANNELYLLQSRPITTEINNGNGKLFVWDNSNIVESYGGITKPLTFGFARYVYHQVYVQFCEILMVPQGQIRKMDSFLKNMLGLFYGRVYYNLLNWYKLTNILPGYKFNRKFMETMMGTDESLGDEIAERIRPPEYQNTIGARLKKIVTGFKFFYYHLNIQNIVDKFLKEFYHYYDHYRKLPLNQMTADEIYDEYRKLEKDLLWRWHAPIINDFLCMVHFGVFKALTEKWLGHLGDNFHNDLLAGNGNLESAEPTKRLIEITGLICKSEKSKNLILNCHKEEALEALRQSEFTEIYEAVLDYLDRFGFRCMSEMKLEQKDLHQDPSLLFVFLKNLINAGQTDLEEYERREKSIRENAESELNKNISGLKKIVYRWSLKHARKAVMNRENTRFCRTRVYGVVRSMIFNIGDKLVSQGELEDREDIFYLSLEEFEGIFEGTKTVLNLKSIVSMRKTEYQSYECGDEPDSRFMTRGPVYLRNRHFPAPVTVSQDDLLPNQMAGLGCSPGKIEGKVKVIMSPEDDLELNGEILVTYRTDPGWIPLYPSASGLLVERGGLLSHSAVVAREMGLPTIVSVKGLTKKLKTGDHIRFDGETGLIEIL